MHEPANSTDTSTTTVDVVEPTTTSSLELTEGKVLRRHRKRWDGRTFRFSLASFRYGANFSLRRFSVTEGAFLLMMAYLYYARIRTHIHGLAHPLRNGELAR